jgi:hypothetical protein
MGSCRTFGGAHPSSSIGNGPPAPHRALQLVARERRSVRVLCWLLRLSRAVTPEVNPALFGHAPRDSARADQSTPPTYRHHALAHGANRRGSEHERPLVQHGAPCRSLGATTCHPRRAYSRPIQWPAIIATPATAPGAPLRLDHDRRQRRDGTRLWASRGPVGCRLTWSTHSPTNCIHLQRGRSGCHYTTRAAVVIGGPERWPRHATGAPAQSGPSPHDSWRRSRR